jgi:hypothetical protein
MTKKVFYLLPHFPFAFHEICCTLIFYFVTIHLVFYIARTAGHSNATSSGALHEQRVQSMFVSSTLTAAALLHNEH